MLGIFKQLQMSEIVLRPYQQELCDKVMEARQTSKKILAVAPTGGGKSVMIAWLANNLPGRILILTHRIEILEQNSNWISGAAILNARRRTAPKETTRVVVSMAQTLHARIKKHGIEYMGNFDIIISDEVHVDIFEKVYEKYNFTTLIGFTATPITNKKEVIEKWDDELKEVLKYSRRMCMSKQYDVLITGVTEQDLIDQGYLTPDFNIALKLPNMDKLVKSDSQPDGYTTNSLNEVYANKVSYKILWEAYQKHCVGKKTMIFNATTKVNIEIYEFFIEQGVNCKVFDSVNNIHGMSRKEIIEWFRNEKDAILINCNVFTTGFDVDDVEVIMLNRATKSLSLYLQMVGRGSRISEKIFKDKYYVIDLGQNFAEHGLWSLKRDWYHYFKPGEFKLVNQSDALDLWECKECGYYNEAGTLFIEDVGIVCNNCNEPRSQGKKGQAKDGELVVITKKRPPNAKHIIEYTKRVGEDANFAFKLLEKLVVDLFLDYSITQDFYHERANRFYKRISDICRPVYFAIINDDELPGHKRKKLKTRIDKIVESVENNLITNET
jgi:superfamily II DNA or RNA helicase